MSKEKIDVLIINVDNHKFAFPIEMVEGVIMAQEITPSDDAKGVMTGVINFHGDIIPVFSLRRRFSLPEVSISPDNLFTILSFKKMEIAVIADSILGIKSIDKSLIRDYKEIVPGMSELEFYSDTQGIYYIYNTENLLSPTEEEKVRKINEDVST